MDGSFGDLGVADEAKPFDLGLEGGEAAVEAGLDGGERGLGDAGDLFEGKIFEEAEDEDLAGVGFERVEDFVDLGAVFADLDLLEGGRIVNGELDGAVVLGAVRELVEADGGALAGEIDNEVAGDGEEPSVEAGFAVVLGAAEEDADPGLLEEVFGDLAVAGKEEEVTEEAMLVLLDEPVEEVGVLPLEAAGDGGVLGVSLRGDQDG